MNYLWQYDGWPHLTYDEHAYRSDIERTLIKAGMQTGLSDSEQFATLVNELSDETVNSFAIEGENLNQKLIRDSLIASLTSRDRKQATGAYGRVADVMVV